MLLMITNALRVYKNIINENYDISIKIRTGRPLHLAYKGYRSIIIPKIYHKELIVAISFRKRVLGNRDQKRKKALPSSI